MNDLQTINETTGELHEIDQEILEQVLATGNIGALTTHQRVSYYTAICQRLGLNPLTRPFEYLSLNGKITLYARRDATDQLRANKQVSIQLVGRERIEDVWIVTARASTPDGRVDESTGAVTIGNLRGDSLANALMKAETKAKRRVTLSICGLGWTDETEIETIPGAKVMQGDVISHSSVSYQPQDNGKQELLENFLDEISGMSMEYLVEISGPDVWKENQVKWSDKFGKDGLKKIKDRIKVRGQLLKTLFLPVVQPVEPPPVEPPPVEQQPAEAPVVEEGSLPLDLNDPIVIPMTTGEWQNQILNHASIAKHEATVKLFQAHRANLSKDDQKLILNTLHNKGEILREMINQ